MFKTLCRCETLIKRLTMLKCMLDKGNQHTMLSAFKWPELLGNPVSDNILAGSYTAKVGENTAVTV